MINYFYLQLKRIAKLLPFVLAVTVSLLAAFVIVLYSVFSMFLNTTGTSFTIAVTGDTDNEYLQWGLAAMDTFNDGNFSIAFEKMTEAQAKDALAKGDVSAYIMMPENFVENALSGEISPITYVTSAGMEGITGIFKREITTLATDIVVYSQKGAYGVGEALYDNGFYDNANEHMTRLSLEYTDLIFNRGNLYSVKELGFAGGLSTSEYYVFAVTVMLISLIGLPFAAIFIKKDYTFNRLMVSRMHSSAKQIICEFFAYLIAMLLQSALILGVAALALKCLPQLSAIGAFLPDIDIIKIIPFVIMISAFNFMMFELAGNMVSGLLLHFFAVISMCYVSGCMYPIYAFPDVIKHVASFLPTGAAMNYLATSVRGANPALHFAVILTYTVIFFALAWFVRYRKTTKIRG